jgi:type II secretory pathway component PulF
MRAMRAAPLTNAGTSFGTPQAARPAPRAADVSVPIDLPRRQLASRRRIRKQDIADMTAQLAIMTKSGVDLASALSSLALQTERPFLASVLRDVHELVLSGNTLSEALRQHDRVFDAAYVATIAAAEASGKMADVLQQLAEMQRAELRLRRSIKALLTYPIMLTAISGTVIVALVLLVLPRFAEIFAQHEMALPVFTQALLTASTELRERWWLWGTLLTAGVGGAVAWRVTDQGRRMVDSLLINGGIVRNVTRPLLIGRTCRMLGLLLGSGVPLLEGLRLCRRTIGNLIYCDLLDDLIESVVNGSGLAPALEHAAIVPISAREMLGTAERTGNLGDVAVMLGSYFEEDAETRMRSLVRLLEPAITVVMGLVVAAIVMSVMLPIFDLSSMSKQGGH